MSPEAAETIALKALAWLVGNAELLPIFLGSTGTSEAELKERATDHEFQVSILEFVTMEDTWVEDFCNTTNLAYTDPLHARYALPGAEQVHWT